MNELQHPNLTQYFPTSIIMGRTAAATSGTTWSTSTRPSTTPTLINIIQDQASTNSTDRADESFQIRCIIVICAIFAILFLSVFWLRHLTYKRILHQMNIQQLAIAERQTIDLHKQSSFLTLPMYEPASFDHETDIFPPPPAYVHNQSLFSTGASLDDYPTIAIEEDSLTTETEQSDIDRIYEQRPS